MRLTKEESARLGKVFADKINAYCGPVAVLLPQKGFSVIGEPGKPFHDAFADEAFFHALKENLDSRIETIDLDCSINAPEFSACAAETLTRLMS
jgi:uncharacterized protein (UPF0261 family)